MIAGLGMSIGLGVKVIIESAKEIVFGLFTDENGDLYVDELGSHFTDGGI